MLISFVFGNRYFTAAELYDHDADIKGHAIVGLSCKTNSNGSHEILVWDPNLQTVDKLTVSSDNKTLNFVAGGYTYARVCAIQPVSSCASTFDKVNIQKYLSGSTSGKASSGMYTLETTLSDFTLTAADGSKAVFKNGAPVSGSLNVGVSLIVGGSAASRYVLPASSSYSISTDRDVTGEVAISAGGTYVELESKGFNALSISGSSVSVSAASAGQQNISVTADKLGSTWNSVTVSAADTRLTLDVGDSSVKVSSANNVSATIVGSNVYTDKSSGAKSVAVTDCVDSLRQPERHGRDACAVHGRARRRVLRRCRQVGGRKRHNHRHRRKHVQPGRSVYPRTDGDLPLESQRKSRAEGLR